MDKLIELAERCEQATGPDRETDCLVHCAVKGWPIAYQGKDIFADMGPGMRRVLVGWIDPGKEQRNFSMTSDSLAPSYTASLDAAMTLVPEGCHLQHFSDTDGDNPDEQRWTAAIRARESGGVQWNTEARVWCATGPLALCAAALRARSSILVSGCE